MEDRGSSRNTKPPRGTCAPARGQVYLAFCFCLRQEQSSRCGALAPVGLALACIRQSAPTTTAVHANTGSGRSPDLFPSWSSALRLDIVFASKLASILRRTDYRRACGQKISALRVPVSSSYRPLRSNSLQKGPPAPQPLQSTRFSTASRWPRKSWHTFPGLPQVANAIEVKSLGAGLAKGKLFLLSLTNFPKKGPAGLPSGN